MNNVTETNERPCSSKCCRAAELSPDELYRSLTDGFEDDAARSIQQALNLALDAKE